MSVVITSSEVKNGFITTVPDDEIDLLIEIISESDACLDAANVPASRQKMLKIYGVRHMLWMQSNNGKGVVSSEHAPSGASRSYASWRGVGVEASPYGANLKQLDSSGCVVGLLQYDGSRLAMMSIGGSNE